VKLNKNASTMRGLLDDAMPGGLLTEEWNAKGRELGIGVKRRADLVDIRRELQGQKLVHECTGRWFLTKS
jgi:hypothetical protein